MGKKAAAAAAKDGGAGASKAPSSSGKEKKPPEAAAKAQAKGKAAKEVLQQQPQPQQPQQDQEPSEQGGLLSRFRPKPRPIFFLAFAICCVCVVALYEPCDKKGKKRDCGYSGITANNCRTVACFMKGGGSMMKKVVKVSRSEGSTLGLTLSEEGSGLTVKEVLDGAVRQHNLKLAADAEDYIAPGDKIVKLSGTASTGSIKKAMQETAEKTLEFEISRSRLPSFLQWVQNPKGKPNMVEKMLTSPGSVYFAKTWFFNAKLAFACWLVSGYPLTSLPMYFSLSAAVAWQLSRCCHDENVGGGVPHCFRSKREPMPDVFQKVWTQGMEWAAKVQKDPRAYVEGVFLPTKR